ncbi:putative receptor-like protein kinase At5g39000 isoform X2 [Lactuca sativa]|nr:putative receptor-like protein kinase At5g39000 isoform X2 [Lactuca sativa]XP_042758353.1 putative receptor-like protein kinase At5g39000 isoform X2 [Lactuca sativa]
MQNFYRHYFQKDIQPFQNSEEAYRTLYLTKAYRIAKVLYTVLKSVSLLDSVKVPEEILKAHEFVVAKAGIYTRDIFRLEPETSDQKAQRHPEIFITSSNDAKKAELHTDNILPCEPGSSNQDQLRYPEMKQLNHCRIPLEAIKDSTQDFNSTNFIGKGGYGSVYKGILTWEDHVNELVAVKRLDVTGFQGKKEFLTEVSILSQYQHENIITLIGFCDDNGEMILVYEYATHGSLDQYLRDTTISNRLSWPQLLKICIGVASALDYLHNHVAEKHRIIHRDIKSSNVLLDENGKAKLSDFGLARIALANQQNTLVITNIAGTYGYNDPQYERTGYLSKESDVYSFGVVLFEVLCGRLAYVLSYHDEHRFLHHLARTHYEKGELDKIIDQRIRNDIKPITLKKFSAIAYRCLQETREQRPAIADVVFQLKVAMRFQELEDEEDEFYLSGYMKEALSLHTETIR